MARRIYSTLIKGANLRATLTGALISHDIAISMDGRGRALDNIFVERLWRIVKHEDVYLKGYVDLPGLHLGLTEYFEFYNTERPHQSYELPANI
jgi:putative transposase